MTLLQPVWLILAIPLAVALYLWRPRSRLLLACRVLTVLCIVLALAQLAVRLPSGARLLVIVTDRSDSMPEKSRARQVQEIKQVKKAMGARDEYAVVSFGRTSAIEHLPSDKRFAGFTHENLGADASHLADALQTALALVPKDRPAKILVLSDGRWTGGDPIETASLAVSRRVSIDFRAPGPVANDVAIVNVDAPQSVSKGEGFLIVPWIYVPTTQKVTIKLERPGAAPIETTQVLPAGLQRVRFEHEGLEAGTQQYSVEVTGSGKDPVKVNNRARALVGVSGDKPLLHVTRKGAESGLATMLRSAKIKVVVKKPSQCAWTLEELSNYSAVLLENVPATTSILDKDGAAGDELSHDGMATLASWVQKSGSGLMMTGGKGAYGSGGYYKSPLDPILPVSMELRQEHRKFRMAIVVALDRSGSMSMQVAGRTKMDLANEGTAQVLDLLGPKDELGVLAVDTTAKEIAELGAVKDKGALRGKILGIQPGGGGIFVYEALSKSVEMLRRSDAGARHIILFADAADAEQPGRVFELLKECQRAGITVSVIGLGTKEDKDAELLLDIARDGKGRAFFTDRAEDLPRLFAQDTFVVARSTFLDEKTRIESTPALKTILSKPDRLQQSIGGYNLCYRRNKALQSVMTLDDYKAPVVATWNAGLGRVLCYTGEADGEFTGAIAGWELRASFFAGMVRWTMGESSKLAETMRLTQSIEDGVKVIKLHLDPDRASEPFAGLPKVTTLSSIAHRAADASERTMHWDDPSTLALATPLRDKEVSMSTVEIPGQNPITLPPMTLPYSPEHRPEESRRGLRGLQKLSRSTGGRERVELASIWKDVPRAERMLPLTNWLLLIAVVLTLLEVLERRTSLVSHAQRWVWSPRKEPRKKRRWWTWRRRERATTAPLLPKVKRRAQPAVVEVPEEEPEPAAEEEAKPEPAPAVEDDQKGDLMSAIREARRRTRDKYER